MNKAKLKEKYGDEKVFVIPYNVVSGLNDKFTPEKAKKDVFKSYDNVGKYLLRYEVEGDSSLQQIIPYFFITNGKANKETKFYVSKRLQGDSRLVDKMSLGFGGHINECDGYTSCIYKALIREMHEELNIDNNYIGPIYLGTMRDMTSNTNDHFGLVFQIICSTEEISIKETDSLEGQWMSLKELYDNYHKFENWSKYLIDYFYEKSRSQNIDLK